MTPTLPRVLSASLVALALAGSLSASELAPRTPIPKSPVRATPLPDDPTGRLPLAHRLEVKFVDAAKVRAVADGGVVSRTGAELSEVEALIEAHGLSFSPMMELDDEALTAFEKRAADRSGRAQPDLGGILAVDVPDSSPARLEAIGAALQELEVVEFAFVHLIGCPPPGDIAPSTPNLSGQQDYSDPDPGLDFAYAWSQGHTGKGVRISDCEYDWVENHEDLVDITIHSEPGQTPDPLAAENGFDEHGTAVLGETSAVPNDYGCRGMAPDSAVYTYTEWSVQQGPRRLAAVTNAINDSDAGDVVLLEMQAGGPTEEYVPAEYDPAIWAVCKAGVDAGVVVVAAAGNGNQNLDGSLYQSYMNRGDSGAIIVGAGTADGLHNKLSFSTYGSRVNVQGWGTSVFTIGYGDYAQYGGDKNQRYTDTFNGTSSASPLVAAACCVLQDASITLGGGPIDPKVLRQLLIDTGTPQGSGGHIGPLPDLRAALENLEPPSVWTPFGAGVAGVYGNPELSGEGSLEAGSNWTLDLIKAAPNAPAVLFIGASAVNLPLLGGTLIPSPDLIVAFPSTSFFGSISLGSTAPAGIASGGSFYFQYWIADSAAVQGASASNAVRADS